MKNVFGKLKKKNSGQAVKATMAQQDWTMRSFHFLEANLTIRTDTRQLGKVSQPMEVEEEEDYDDDVSSVCSVCSSSQPPSASQPSSSQASPSQVRSTRPKAPQPRGSTRPS